MGQGSPASEAAKGRVKWILRALLTAMRPINFAFFAEVIVPFILATLNGQELEKSRPNLKGNKKNMLKGRLRTGKIESLPAEKKANRG